MSAPRPPRLTVRVQADLFDAAQELGRFAATGNDGAADVGAIVSFTGLCRDEAGTLQALEIEHYPGMAEAELTRVAEDALRRWPCEALVLIHRHGLIRPGEPIVFVLTASRHRAAAFAAADFLMDYLKTRAPFWKKEHRQDGSTTWVDAKASDDEAAARWSATDPADESSQA